MCPKQLIRLSHGDELHVTESCWGCCHVFHKVSNMDLTTKVRILHTDEIFVRKDCSHTQIDAFLSFVPKLVVTLPINDNKTKFTVSHKRPRNCSVNVQLDLNVNPLLSFKVIMCPHRAAEHIRAKLPSCKFSPGGHAADSLLYHALWDLYVSVILTSSYSFSSCQVSVHNPSKQDKQAENGLISFSLMCLHLTDFGSWTEMTL